MSEAPRARLISPGRRHALRLGLMAAAATIMPGCVPVFTPMRVRHPSSTRGPIPRESTAFLTTGTTTRTEVLLRLGLPDEVHNDDRQFAYSWAIHVGLAGVVGFGGAVGAMRVEQHRLLLEFDETGILRRQDHQIAAEWR